MRRIHLDLLKSRPAPGIAAAIAFVSGLLALLAAAFWHYTSAAEADARRMSLERKLRDARAAIAARKPRAPRMDRAQVSDEWNRAMRASTNLNSPWSELFETLERESERPVGLLTLDTDAVRRSFALSAEAKNFDEMLAYLRFLQGCGQLSDVVLDTHQVNRQSRETPVRFRITAHWVEKS